MLNAAGIACRIPHQGRMCLLERVAAWDAQRIHCESSTHHAADNPLRAYGRLGIACGIEYAAQAMAVHGALIAEAAGVPAGGPPRVGYLASVRGVAFHAARLDDVAGSLQVRAQRLLGDDNNIVYAFEVGTETHPLLSGRATVVIDASLGRRFGAGAA